MNHSSKTTISNVFNLFRKKRTAPNEQDSSPECLVRVGCPTHNCGGRCLLVAHVRDGVITRLDADDRPDTLAAPQLRACVRGRAYPAPPVPPRPAQAPDEVRGPARRGPVRAHLLGRNARHGGGRDGESLLPDVSESRMTRMSGWHEFCSELMRNIREIRVFVQFVIENQTLGHKCRVVNLRAAD